MSSKQPAKKENTELALTGYEDYAGAGFENQDSSDYTIPFINILQALSPQIQDDESGTFKQGMIFNTVTGEIVDSKVGIVFVPATTQHSYVEFKPRDAGGGFVGIHEVNSELVQACVSTQDFGDYKTPEGNELIETYYTYGICIDESGNSCEAVIAFAGAKIKKYKAWMTKAKTVQIQLSDGRRIPAPLFAHKYRLKTVLESNPKGKFYNWDISFDGATAVEARLSPEDPVFQAAASVRELIAQGEARAAYESQVPASEENSEGGGGKTHF